MVGVLHYSYSVVKHQTQREFISAQEVSSRGQLIGGGTLAIGCPQLRGFHLGRIPRQAANVEFFDMISAGFFPSPTRRSDQFAFGRFVRQSFTVEQMRRSL